ncbi:hypothetical protein WN944_018720 [Citrus x changshan-huyou]|uniref:Ubiquitin-like protease family profile domain-containing protein n=1 Tax=Citrus x changshan-huyou TaxID=2935761 RepID=A0AAP0LTY1_9ROSI
MSFFFDNFNKEAVQKIKEKDEKACITKEIKKEIGMAFKNLPTNKRCKYTVGKNIGVCLNGERPKVDTTRSVLCVNGRELELSAQSFGQIIGISDGGMHVELDGDVKQIALRGSVMEGYRAIYQGEESYQLVNREQKEYGTKIRQWAHELQANIAARNYEPIEMDGSNDEIDEGIIWHGNGSRKKSKIVREDGAGDEMPLFGRLEQQVLLQGNDVLWLGTWKGLREWYMEDLLWHHQMRALDKVLQDDIKMLFGNELSFHSFTMVHSKRMHRQPNSYDCGLFVIWYM